MGETCPGIDYCLHLPSQTFQLFLSFLQKGSKALNGGPDLVKVLGGEIDLGIDFLVVCDKFVVFGSLHGGVELGYEGSTFYISTPLLRRNY